MRRGRRLDLLLFRLFLPKCMPRFLSLVFMPNCQGIGGKGTEAGELRIGARSSLRRVVQGQRIAGYVVFHCWNGVLELTETEPMDHESLVTSQAMYAYDDDSACFTRDSTIEIAFLVTVKDENGNDSTCLFRW